MGNVISCFTNKDKEVLVPSNSVMAENQDVVIREILSSRSNNEVVIVPSSVADNQDLVREILSRLPVKSLVRFKCVSKDWFALLNQDFILKSNLRTNTILYFIRHEGGREHHKFSLHGRNDVDDTLPRVVESPAFVLNQLIQSINIVGSSNGLVCLHLRGIRDGKFQLTEEQIIIWNPVTKQYRILPKPLSLEPNDRVVTSMKGAALLGFGFVQRRGRDGMDYKVVRVSERRLGRLTAQVFTSSAKSWSVVAEQFDQDCYAFYSTRITMNGVLYFLALTEMGYYGHYGGEKVLSFNLQQEVIDSATPLPSDFYKVRRARVTIIEFTAWNNSVAFLSEVAGERGEYHIWVMTPESTQMPITSWNWTKVTIVKLPQDTGWLYQRPYGIWDNQLIFPKLRPHSHRSESRLCSYDLGQREMKLIRPAEGFESFDCSQVVEYVESLASV